MCIRLNKKSACIAFFSRGFFAGISIFLFLCATEITLTYLLKGKLRPEKILFYAVTYAIIGAVFGAGFSALRLAVSLVKARFTGTIPSSIDTPVLLTGFIWFYTFVTLNSYYLSNSSLFSFRSILLDCVLALCCVAVFMFSYVLRKKRENSGLAGAVNAVFTAAIVLTALHAFVSPKFGALDHRILPAAGITAGYALTGIVALLIDHAIAILFTAIGKSTLKICTVSVAMKALVISVCFGILLYWRHSAGPVQRIQGAYASPETAGTPNIALLVLDTVRQDHIGVYGAKEAMTPNIDRFAGEGYVFNAYSTANWTWPSHASIITGLYAVENGTSSSLCLDERNETLAEELKRSGYSTAGFVSNFGFLGPGSGFAQGFDCYFAECAELTLPFPFLATHLLLKFYPDATALNIDPCLRGGVINKKAVEWLRQNRNRPFFLFLNYMDAHAPYNASPPYDKLGPYGSSDKDIFRADIVSYLKYEAEVSTGKRRVTENEREFLCDQYNLSIRSLDDRVGEFLSTLKEMGLYEKTLIIITADHGEGFGEHGIVQHTGSLYEEMIHVPLLIKPPAGISIKPPSGPVSLIYLFHSILNFLDIPHDVGSQDVDLFHGQTASILAEFHRDAKTDRLLAHRFGKNTYCLIKEI